LKTVISLLRGINVGGKNKLAMTDLKALCGSLKFTKVNTFIQSGNIVFSSGLEDLKEVSVKLESGIYKRFGLKVPVISRDVQELEQAISRNPFLKDNGRQEESLYITYMESAPKPDEINKISGFSVPTDEFRIIGRQVYIYCPGGYGNTKLNNNFFENKLKVRATTRNLKTSKTLLDMALSLGY
jgi:uncharacterized protein (DUF1697 family)